MLILLPPEQSALFNHTDRLLVKIYQPVWDVQCVLLKDSCTRLSWWNWMFDIECKQKFSTAKKTPNGSLFCERKGLFRILLCEFYQTPLFFQFSLCLIHYNSRKPLDGKFVLTVDSDNTSFRNVVSINCWNKFLFKTVSWNYMNETAKIKN